MNLVVDCICYPCINSTLTEIEAKGGIEPSLLETMKREGWLVIIL